MFSRKISTSNGAPRFGHILKLILLILKMVAIGGDIFVEMVLFLTNSKVEIIKAAEQWRKRGQSGMILLT